VFARSFERRRQRMNKWLMVSVVVLGLVALSGAQAVVAEAPSKEIYAKVRFPFMVGEKIFMPGDYQISLVSHAHSAIKVTSWDGKASVEVPVITRLARQDHSDHVTLESLVFHRVGEMGILSEVWMHSGDGFLVMGMAGDQTVVTVKHQE
jgi:hypothetical protein